MLLYLLKLTLMMALLLAVYHLFLSRERLLRFSRCYLMGALILSLVVPLIHFEIQPSSLPAISSNRIVERMMLSTDVLPLNSAVAEDSRGIKVDFGLIALALYLLGAAVMLGRLVANVEAMLRLIRTSLHLKNERATIVLVDDLISPFSFYRYIFVHKIDYQEGNVASEIISHEMTHVCQRHSLDVLLLELLQVALWFNPLIYLYKKQVKLTHEYLADEHVITHHQDVHKYQHLLLDTIFRKNTPSLVSNIGFSLTKKRLIMMTRKTSLHKKVLLGFICISIATLLTTSMCVVSAQAKEGAVDPQTQNRGRVASGKPQPYLIKIIRNDAANGASVVAKVTKDNGKTWCNLTDLSKEELEGLEKEWMKRFELKVPTNAQMKEWSNTSTFGLWIDGKHYADNGILSKHQNTDFKSYTLSRLAKNAKHGVNKGKSFQLDLMTNSAYEEKMKNLKDKFQRLKDGDQSVLNELLF
ncbi:M56 family metallopeptidase [Alistipes sp. ZOR0009]|uniref:M56 family metallopeptidase n=1 Tax=Alistipes sp. ZOR0009 TaxID=1339253 RepID=UPI00064784E1|nr:M56 family metallopeptidase [Alistipes sp. ZOR0009]